MSATREIVTESVRFQRSTACRTQPEDVSVVEWHKGAGGRETDTCGFCGRERQFHGFRK